MELLTVLTYLAGAVLCLYLFVLIAVFGVAMYFLGKYLRIGNEKVTAILIEVDSIARKIQGYTQKGLDAVAEPEVRLTAGASAVEAFVKRLLA